MALVRFDLACNDPDNGNFSGRLLAAEYGGMELRHDDWLKGCAVSFPDERTVRVSRRRFKIAARKCWAGNWCWDTVWMNRKEAHRLLRYLRDSGKWHCEAAPTRLFDWFNGLHDDIGEQD